MENTCQETEANSAAQEDISSLETLTQSYLSLKKRICSAHEVITQYNDKVKECDRLKTELKLATKQAHKATFDYNTTLAKVLKVELQNTEYQKKIQSLTAAVESHEVKIAADNKHIQQLTCKISDIETQNNAKIMEYDLEKASLQMRIKELEQELKTAKKPHEAQLKKLEKKLNAEAAKPKLKIPAKSTMDVGVNTTPKLLADIGINTVRKSTTDCAVNTTPVSNFVKPKPKSVDKCSMTKEFYNVKDNLYPVFCNKCVTEIVPPPLDKICNIMKDQCLVPIERIRSPSPIRASSPLSKRHDVADNQCKAESLSDTCSHTSGQTNQNSFPLPNVLPSSSPSVPLQATYFNEFIPQQLSNLINQNKYYIPVTTNTHSNQNSTSNMSTLNSSLSVVETLEKRIESLESKLKKQLKKRKAMENSNCWQRKRPTSCSHETDSTSQSNITLNLMEKMLELCNRNQTRETDLYKAHMLANLVKPKVKKTRQKKKKRLQRAAKPVWKIENMPKVVEQSCVQKKSKKRKLLTLFGDHDRQTSDHDDADLNVDSKPHYAKSTVYSSSETSPPISCQIERKSVKPIKSHSNETDSGLSSDWLDSCRATHCETDAETCSTVGEDRGSIEEEERKSSDQDTIVCHSSINEPPSECIEDGDNEAASISEEHIKEEAKEAADTELRMDTEVTGSLEDEDNPNTITSEVIPKRNITEPLEVIDNYNAIKDASHHSEESIEERTEETPDIKSDSDTENEYVTHNQDDCDSISQTVPTTSIFDCISEDIEDDGITESSVLKEDIEEKAAEVLDSPDSPDLLDSPDSPDLLDSPDSPDLLDSPDSPDLLDSPDSPDLQDSQDSPDSPDPPDLPHSQDSPDSPDPPDLPHSQDSPDSPDPPDLPHSPDSPDTSDLDIKSSYLPSNQDDCDAQPVVPTKSIVESSSECVKNDEIKESSVSKQDIEEKSKDTLDSMLHADIKTENSPQNQSNCSRILSQLASVTSIGETSFECSESDEFKEEPSMLEEHIEETPVEPLDTELNSDTELYEKDDSDTLTLETAPKKRGRPAKKKLDNRQELLKKLRQLKKPKKEVVIQASLADYLNPKTEEPDNCKVKMNIDLKAEVFTPRNRIRVAHTPKHTLPESDFTIKPVTRINLYDRTFVPAQGGPTAPKQLVSNTQEILSTSVSQEVPISGRIPSCTINPRKRKISDIVEPSTMINTKTIKTELESSCLNVTSKSVNIEMNIASPGQVSNDLENVTQKDNINTQVLNLDCNTEKLINTSNDTTSISDSTFKGQKPLIKGYLNQTNTSYHNVKNSSLCKYELLSSQVESHLQVNDLKAESIVPLCINELRKDTYNETAGAERLTNSYTFLKLHMPKKNVIAIQNNSAKNSEPYVQIDSQLATPYTLVMQYAKKRKPPVRSTKQEKRELVQLIQLTDEFVTKQLDKLLCCPWTVVYHDSVLEKLKDVCSSRILAKCIIAYLSTENKYNIDLDKTYTPPAPLMTRAQQKIMPLIIDLRQSHPDIVDLVLAGIEFELFRPRKTAHPRWLLASLTGMYIALVRVMKDREKLRIFCFDAMYFLHFNSMIVLYTVITSWAEVFPNFASTKEVLPRVMAHVILTQQCAYGLPKLSALKSLMSLYYQYPKNTHTKQILTELIAKLQEKPYNGLEAAIILIAKRENTMWTHKNLITGALLPLIICNKVPDQYKAFRLLGNLLRPFPQDDFSGPVSEIAEQLRDLINSGQMGFEEEEGIIAALLSLSRQHRLFDMIADTVLKWKPSQPLRFRTRQQVKGFLRLRDPKYWSLYLRRYRHPNVQAIGEMGM